MIIRHMFSILFCVKESVVAFALTSVWNNSTLPATILFLFNDYFFSSGQGQGCPVALKVGRCASTFRR